jgi:predicted extracellular nuclease
VVFWSLWEKNGVISLLHTLPEVSGTASWHINADESRGLDYNDFNQPGLFSPDQFRASDHDAIVVGLLLDEDNVQFSLKCARIW